MHLMKTFFAVLALLVSPAASLLAADPLPRSEDNVSFRNEIQIALEKGLAWLKGQQNPDGSWSTADHPALTALVLLSFHREPTGKYAATKPEFLEKGYAFLRANRRPDGGIYRNGLSNYNTS